MHQPTPFAQLGYAQKTASELFSTGNAAADLGVEMLAGSNPFSGVPFYGARAVDDFTKGKVMSGLGNLFWGGLSFLPGAIAAKGVTKGITAGVAKNPGMIAKGFNAIKKPITGMIDKIPGVINTAAKGTGVTGTLARGAQQYGQAIQKGKQAVNKTISPMLDAAGSRLAGKTLPMTGGKQISQQAGRQAVGWGGYLGASGVADMTTSPTTAVAAPAASAVTPTAPQYAPSWYAAVTGDTTMPQYR